MKSSCFVWKLPGANGWTKNSRLSSESLLHDTDNDRQRRPDEDASMLYRSLKGASPAPLHCPLPRSRCRGPAPCMHLACCACSACSVPHLRRFGVTEASRRAAPLEFSCVKGCCNHTASGLTITCATTILAIVTWGPIATMVRINHRRRRRRYRCRRYRRHNNKLYT